MDIDHISTDDDSNRVEIPLEFPDFFDQEEAHCNPFEFPYKNVLCFLPFLEKVKELAESDDVGQSLLAREVLKQVERHPELAEPIDDDVVIKPEYSTFIQLSLSLIIAPVSRDEDLVKISRPFGMEPLLLSPAAERLMYRNEASYSFDLGATDVKENYLASIGCFILQQCYDVEIAVRPDAILTVKDEKTGLQRFYRPTMDESYIQVSPIGELPELSEQDIQLMLANPRDTELWARYLPHDKFLFRGFHLVRLYEVTEQESLSRLRQRLISRDAVLSADRAKELADLVRVYFKLPNMEVGVTAMDYPEENSVDHDYQVKFNLLFDTDYKLNSAVYQDSVYHRAFRGRDIVIVDDLSRLKTQSALEKALIIRGVHNLALVPLLNQSKEVIGLLEFASSTPGAFSVFHENKFEEVRRLFRSAVERSREYIDNRIEAIIRDRYTNIHPAVEWKFRECAFEAIRDPENDNIPEISFPGVFPLYGQADIVGSSQLRNAAIYQDLIDNLRSGKHILEQALRQISFPLIDQVLLSLNKFLEISAEAFDNGDELRIGDFIHVHLTPLIIQLGKNHEFLRPFTQAYENDLNDSLGLFYRVRRDYENSVKLLNQRLSDFFYQRDLTAQASLPHFFEKYKTDGVEYELYVGQSLLKHGEFTPIHLRNFRLAQVIDLADATRMVEQLKEEMAMPLRTAQLIFVYSTPIDIRFRMDEKRFDVDGDYNVRYEILKKRIDKATINNGAQRLVQPGMVSIVYLQDRDEDEYREYINYLDRAGYIEGEVEQCKLDPLQSVNGLRALRFRVKQ